MNLASTDYVDSKSSGGLSLADVKSKCFNFKVQNNSNDWMFDGVSVVQAFNNLDGFITARIGTFPVNSEWTWQNDQFGCLYSFYSQPVTLFFNKETTINEILSNLPDNVTRYIDWACPLVYLHPFLF